jgi:hypothetical protein
MTEHGLEALVDALECEADVQALRARRALVLDLIGAVPGARVRARLLEQLAERERALVPDERERRALLGDETPNDDKE